MPWRWPFILNAFAKMDDRSGFETASVAEFGLGLGDALSFCVLLVPLCTGLQTVQLLGRISEGQGFDGTSAWWSHAWISLFYLAVDLLVIAFW